LAHLSLTEVVGLLSCADAFVGNDSGVTHLAAAMGLRTVALFCPTDPAVYRPLGPTVTVLRDDTDKFAQRPSRTLQKAVLEALVF
jgi:ADP-heptose:LPS heptosyltransferase